MSLKNSGLEDNFLNPLSLQYAHPTLKLESEYSRQEMNFLDIAFRLNRSKFIPDQIYKVTNSY